MSKQFSSDYTSKCWVAEKQCCPGHRAPGDCEYPTLCEEQNTFTSSDGTGKPWLFLPATQLSQYDLSHCWERAPVTIPLNSLFPGQLEYIQVKIFIVRWKIVNSAPLCPQREAQLHHTFHQVTPCLIKISMAKLSRLKISFIMKSAGYRETGDGLIELKILPVKYAVAHQGMWPAAKLLGNVLG